MIENHPSLRRFFIRWLIRILVKTILRPWMPLRLQRWLLDAVAWITGPPRHPRPEPVKLRSVPGLRYLVRDGPADTAVLYLHGGGYVAGSSRSHRNISARLSRLLGADLYAIDYRLAPEHPYPAAVDDAVEAYAALREPERGYRRIIVIGDSAGGALSVILPLRVRDEGQLPLPDAVVAFSPFVDHTEEAPDDGYDDMLDPRWGALVASWYLRDTPKDHPYISPVFADLHGLPPTLIQVGGDELLADQGVLLGEKMAAAGVKVHTEVYPHVWHVFQTSAGLLPDANRALQAVKTFVDEADAPAREAAAA